MSNKKNILESSELEDAKEEFNNFTKIFSTKFTRDYEEEKYLTKSTK